MNLAKLTIDVETAKNQFGKHIVALFNPEQLSITKTANWSTIEKAEGDVPSAQFTHGEPATLSLDLTFDTYEQQQDVQNYTRELYALTTVQNHGNLHRPPLCKLHWGTFTIDNFQWVVTSLTQNFLLFLPDGTPVRAKIACSFRQWRSDEEEARLLNKQSVDVAKTHIVRRGDTLSSIANQHYDDPTQWRPIADANTLINPRKIIPGQVLIIPILRDS